MPYSIQNICIQNKYLPAKKSARENSVKHANSIPDNIRCGSRDSKSSRSVTNTRVTVERSFVVLVDELLGVDG